MTPQEIAALLQEHGGSRDVEDVDEVTKIDDSHQKRTNLLSDVLATCKEAWTSNSIDIEAIAEKLADGSRDGEFYAFSTNPSSFLLSFRPQWQDPNLVDISGMETSVWRFWNTGIFPQPPRGKQHKPKITCALPPVNRQLLCRYRGEPGEGCRSGPPVPNYSTY